MKKFLREAFSENGVGSFSRVASGIHMVAGIAWVSHVVWHAHALPSGDSLAGVAAIMVAPYGANRLSSAIAALRGNGGGGSQ